MLHYNTVIPLLKTCLEELMNAECFANFRLVGGTALSLYYGHRMSIDIDLFTDADYGTVDFEAIDHYLRRNYPYVDTNDYNVIGMGKSYYIGANAQECIKLDLFYTDPFVFEINTVDNIRFATVEEIIAMKLDVVQRGGRKKDFWDIHELKDAFNSNEMIRLHELRYPHTHDRMLLIKQFTNFTEADNDFEPDCLRNKHWELIKLDLVAYIDEIDN